MSGMETIFALSSGAVPSGVAVIRVSGPGVEEALVLLTGSLPQPRRASHRLIRDRNGLVIDDALVLYFPAPHSFTGDSMAEFQIHGSRASVNALLAALTELPGFRPADAGEFTRRAFENGRIDLLEAEGLADLLKAETEMQRRLALEHGTGGVSQVLRGWAEELVRCRALIEAELDFADESDVPGSVSSQVWAKVSAIAGEIDSHLQQSRAGEIIRDGLTVVVMGPPNAGKSSLLNRLAGRDVAIVTDVAGTTRDVLTVDLDIGGFAVRLHDTAGLRETSDPVENEGIKRAREIIARADVVLQLAAPGMGFEALTEIPETTRVIRIATKVDEGRSHLGDCDLALSVKTGEGLQELRQMLIGELQPYAERNHLAIPSRLRHVSHLRVAVDCLRECLELPEDLLELRAEALRRAAQALGRITGQTDVEDLLDVIFSEFCIGK